MGPKLRLRYTGTSLAFNLGGIVGGGLTPALAQVMAERGGLVPVGLYLVAAAVLSGVGLLAARGDSSADAVPSVPDP